MVNEITQDREGQFWFASSLGLLYAKDGQVYRQDLVGFSGINGGSSYALTGVPGWFNHNTNGKLLPNPDYFTARLYRKLVGAIRLSTNYEVDSEIEVLVSDLLDENNITSVSLSTSYMKKVDVPCFKINNHIVWGATGMMLSEIKELLK